MKKRINLIYLFELIILIFIIIFKVIILKKFDSISDLINLLFWVLLCITMLIKYRYPRDVNYFKRRTVYIVIISLLSILIVVYGAGLFTGYTRFVYSHTFINIIKNTLPIILVIIAQNIIRYLVVKNTIGRQRPIIILTALFITLDILIGINYYNFYSTEQIFIFICVVCLPYIAKESLYSYIVYKVSPVPSCILEIAYEIFPYVLPIFPKLGNYLSSILGILFPYIIYRSINKMILLGEKDNKFVAKASNKFLFIPTFCFLLVVVSLISGIFPYKMIAISSGSMNPVYSRGDAVIYKEVTNQETGSSIKKGDIIVFEHNNIIITHRVIKIIENDNVYSFQTKGDNNEVQDEFTVSYTDVLGTVKYVVPYIGYPAIWFSETLKD